MNQLTQETSPYLLMHASNPVNWYPWNQQSLDKAKKENKPILLSVGYAACHWCHVMAHESFEDKETAKLMNELFINIKVDREERPDLDKIYQNAHYFLTQQQGGWPLTSFLTPDDLTPFFSGTYFPREARYHLPSFKEVLNTIADIYQNNRDEIRQQNQHLRELLTHEPIVMLNILNNEPLKIATEFFQQKFDEKNGGFGGAPKFPHPTMLEFLLIEKSPMALKSLMAMAKGGIYDQIQGGIFRYSVDEKWRIPHFEKMLYDNAQLIHSYALASQTFNEPYFAEIARETADWALAKMQSPEGGFYSSLDADTEGHEGRFYVWNKFEIQELLTDKEAEFADIYFGLDNPPNFENAWHLYVAHSLETVAKQLKLSISEAHSILQSIKQKLLIVREKRTQPARDQKILTSWNSLMIKALATAGHILKEPRYMEAALKALNFIRSFLWKNDHLLASYTAGKAIIPGFLDDYAFLLDAVITLAILTGKNEYKDFAVQLADNLLSHFEDSDRGGFFFTADDTEKLLYRPKTLMDEAIPSGNGIAAYALLQLDRLQGQSRYKKVIENTLQLAWPTLSKYPAEHCSLLMVLKEFNEKIVKKA